MCATCLVIFPRSEKTKAAVELYERRAAAIPQLRYEVLEDLSEKKLALEKEIEAMTAPRELARKQTLKEIMTGKRTGGGTWEERG